jgi:WXG100 family type VII secretion target
MQFDVTPEDLLNAATTCQRTNQEIQSQILKIRNYIQGLMASYRGPAALQLQTTSDMWQKDASALNVVLDKIAHNLQINAHNYGHGEGTNVVNLAHIASTLGTARI